jgi:transmembrane sensor
VKYRDYKPEDYLTDKEFIKWITSPTRESEIYWQTIYTNYPEQAKNIDEARRLARMIHFKSLPPSQERKDRILSNTIFNSYSIRSKTQRFTSSRNWKLVARIAASIVIITSLGILLIPGMKPDNQATYISQDPSLVNKQNPAGRKSTFYLPDGSFVKLNAESNLIYQNNFNTTREVWLDGEAFFDVKFDSSKTFVVHSGTFITTVTGTSFNIKNFTGDGEESISLLSGRVLISMNDVQDSQQYELLPGDKLTVNRDSKKLNFSAVDFDEVAWHSGVLVFKNDSYEEFIKKLERWYGVSVNVLVKPRQAINVNGRFNNESLDLVLEGLKFSLDIDYRFDNIEKEVFLKFNK